LSKVQDLRFYYSLTSLFYYSFIILFIYFVFNTQVQTHGYAGSVQGKIWDCIYGLSLHEVNTQGVMLSVICEVFYFFFYYFIIIIIIFIFFLYSTNQLLVHLGVLVLPPYPQQCEGHASRIMWGMSQTMVWGASWNLGGWSENNKCLGL